MKICLVVIYNHNYERNVPVLNAVYEGRFSKICHVMPFFRGGGVYECSYQYNGYIAQAARDFYSDDFDYYCFVADDMVINPSINESNLPCLLGIGKDDGFNTKCEMLSDRMFLSWYGWAVPAILNMCSTGNATEWRNFLPDIRVAREKFAQIGLDWQNMVDGRLVRFLTSTLRCRRENPYKLLPSRLKVLIARMLSFCLQKGGKDCLFKHEGERKDALYPLAAAPGCSDFFVIPRSAAKKFFHYCGVFAAMRNFVEIAIPTAMVLSCPGIKTMEKTRFKSDPPGDGDRRISEEIGCRYGFSYKELVKGFPTEYLYIHPIKLSKWREFT